ncbi:MAG: MGMT family protein [Nanoarchaeota archaeon]
MSFNQKVCKLLLKIPKGKVSTYKDIAEKLNSKAYRAVGNALNKNKHPESYPCYKIINSNGKLGGYSKGLKLKIKKLKKDGIKIKNNKVNLNKYLYKFK